MHRLGACCLIAAAGIQDASEQPSSPTCVDCYRCSQLHGGSARLKKHSCNRISIARCLDRSAIKAHHCLFRRGAKGDLGADGKQRALLASRKYLIEELAMRGVFRHTST